MAWLGRKNWKNPVQLFVNGMKKIDKKNWKKVDAQCNVCGNTFTTTYATNVGKETELQCPKCKARNSRVLYIYK